MNRTIILMGCALLATRATAQTTSDLMPAAPAAPAAPPATAPGAAAGRYLTPGLGRVEAGPVAGDGKTEPGRGARGGLILTDGELDSEEPGEVGRVDNDHLPEVHVVRKGDTLWEISTHYFRNAWYWPKLWSFNPSITNPHWIYPGDLVRLGPKGEAPVPAPPSRVAEAPTTGIKAPPARGTGIFLRQTGFVEPGELKDAGTIVASKEEKIMLATLDEAYVEFKRERPLRVGERYTIYKPINEVKHPRTGKKLGQLVHIFGEVEVKQVTKGNIARCLIIDSLDPIERGFRVGPLRRQFKVVEPKTDRGNLEGEVVATLRPANAIAASMIASDMIVVLDRGEKDGVEVGNRFFVTRRGDGYLPLRSSGPVDDKRYPRENIAEVLVVDLRERISTGLVLKSAKEARVGDRVETRQGY